MTSRTMEADNKTDAYKEGMGALSDRLPHLASAYHEFTGRCFAGGALSGKTKQLLALGISMFANNEVCTYYHAQEAVSEGATPEEIWEVVGVAAAVGGGHVMSQGVTRIRQLLETTTPH